MMQKDIMNILRLPNNKTISAQTAYVAWTLTVVVFISDRLSQYSYRIGGYDGRCQQGPVEDHRPESSNHTDKDPLAGCLMDLAGILYWFNPLVWRALREMLSDREIARGASCLLASAGLQINFRLPLLKIAV